MTKPKTWPLERLKLGPGTGGPGVPSKSDTALPRWINHCKPVPWSLVKEWTGLFPTGNTGDNNWYIGARYLAWGDHPSRCLEGYGRHRWKVTVCLTSSCANRLPHTACSASNHFSRKRKSSKSPRQRYSGSNCLTFNQASSLAREETAELQSFAGLRESAIESFALPSQPSNFVCPVVEIFDSAEALLEATG
eukprot:425759-Prorocentrum_minimum.AAC.2